MDAILPYIATLIAAIGLLLMLIARPGPARVGGGVVGLAGLAWLFVQAGALPGGVEDVAADVLFLIFALIAIAAAVQMIVQQRPVYSALFFVLVVMSVCGVMVMLEAFFMAFALVIVYAGAILITYMFVLMLAQQASDSDSEGEIPSYDRISRDPVSAVFVAALFMAIVVAATFSGLSDLAPAADGQARLDADVALLNSLPEQVRRDVLSTGVDVVLPESMRGTVSAQDGELRFTGVDSVGSKVAVPVSPPGNTSHVGWSLVAMFPASLELAGVILLMAMFGAVVLARREVEHAEEALAKGTGRDDAEFSESKEDSE
ncbi:MAG: NADH-quinone oxidoreductase subunit J [Phycisphaerae bacterium]|nr:NADH-quinone oxidoreductase subunit J [Phycisphaerae bacterium]